MAIINIKWYWSFCGCTDLWMYCNKSLEEKEKKFMEIITHVLYPWPALQTDITLPACSSISIKMCTWLQSACTAGLRGYSGWLPFPSLLSCILAKYRQKVGRLTSSSKQLYACVQSVDLSKESSCRGRSCAFSVVQHYGVPCHADFGRAARGSAVAVCPEGPWTDPFTSRTLWPPDHRKRAAAGQKSSLQNPAEGETDDCVFQSVITRFYVACT